MSILSVRDLTVDLMTASGVVRAVDGVTFDIESGETVTIIGESGSGKSTTAMALLRLLPDDLAVLSGHGEVDGHDVVGTRKHIGTLRGRTVALIPQDPMTALNPIATIGAQMGEAIRLAHRGCSKAEAARRAGADRNPRRRSRDHRWRRSTGSPRCPGSARPRTTRARGDTTSSRTRAASRRGR